MSNHFFLPFLFLCLASVASAQTATTFRGHKLGENWQTFIRTERGLCRLSDTNTRACTQAAAGKDATLKVRSDDNIGEASFRFEGGYFVKATVVMKGPKFAELTDLEKTYGKPSRKNSAPKKGEAYSHWEFPDGGEVTANEYMDDTGQAIIRVNISSPEEVLIRKTAVSALDQVQSDVDILILQQMNGEMKKHDETGEPIDPRVFKFSDKLKQERKKQDEEDSLSWSPELAEGQNVKEMHGWLALVHEEGGDIIVYAPLPILTPMILRELRREIAAYVVLSRASETTVPLHKDQILFDWKSLWLKVRDLYCTQNPGAKYMDLSGNEATCR